MKKLMMLALCFFVLVWCATAQSGGDGQQTEGSDDDFVEPIDEKDVRLLYGPRGGASFVIMSPSVFNTAIQSAFPSDNSYFPIFTQMGLLFTQGVRLGDSDANLVFKELILLGGLDQNIAIPSATFLIGHENRIGISLSVGPFVTLGHDESSSDVRLQFSFAYEIGWTIESKGVMIPIAVMFVPYPSYAQPAITVTLGFMFEAE